ncbi:hypothetical protein BSL78_25733 [Apostichopus japonicus]|uniref:GPI inositol-deacylase transmembrane domain-containing protein n=1 Tax=Stichopus japonicus TaxID=307972 RepID=A0A2G8JNZ8_STIJA|nr:hypothetical protein BSL78_25733 [Apostichopus japonicus]
MFLLSYGLCALLLWTMENKTNNGGRLWKWWKKGELSLDMFRTPKAQESSRLWPIAVVGGTMALAVGTCGAVAIIFISVIVGFKASGLKARVLVAESKLPEEKVKKESTKESKEPPKRLTPDEKVHRRAKDSFHFTTTVHILLNFLVLFAVPTLIAWYENLQFDFRLRNDPTLYPALVASVAVIDILGNPVPLPKKSKLVKPVSWVLYFFTLLMVLYAIESVYRCVYFLSASILLLSFLQLV